MSRNDFRRRQAQRQRRKLVRHLPIILALFLAFSALAAGVFALTRFVLNRQPISSASASSSTAKTTSEDPAQPISSPASGTVSYTHLDVYKRQIQSFTNAIQKGLDYVNSHSSEEIAKVISPHFKDVYKRQPSHEAGPLFPLIPEK